MIIDFHTHIFPDKIAGATISALSKSAEIPPHSNGMKSGLSDSMEKNGIDISVNLPVLTKATQFDSILRFGMELNREIATQGRIVSFAGFHPDIEDYEEKLTQVKENGFLGIKIHPDYQGTFFDDPKYVKILEYAKKLDLITVTHAGLDGAFIGQEIKCTPVRVLNLLDKIGGYDKLVLAHLGGNELYDDVYELLAGKDVYFDTSYVLPFLSGEQLEKMLLRHGDERILFATDSPWQDQGQMADIIRSRGLGKATEEKIFCTNAKKLLGLGEIC